MFVSGGQQSAEYPYVTVQRIVTPGARILDGAANLEWPTVQIDVWSPKGLASLNASEAIRTALDNRTIEQSGVTFTPTFQDQRGPAPDEETRNFRVSQDYTVFHERA